MIIINSKESNKTLILNLRKDVIDMSQRRYHSDAYYAASNVKNYMDIDLNEYSNYDRELIIEAIFTILVIKGTSKFNIDPDNTEEILELYYDAFSYYYANKKYKVYFGRSKFVLFYNIICCHYKLVNKNKCISNIDRTLVSSIAKEIDIKLLNDKEIEEYNNFFEVIETDFRFVKV